MDNHKTRQVPLFPLTNLGGQQGQSYKLQVKVKSCQVLLVISNHLQCFLWSQLLENLQERDEPFRAFTARVRGKAETCAFSTKCECGKNVDYTDHVIRDVLLNGISDPDIRREVLGTKDVLKTPVNDVIALVENKEMARNALPSSTLSVVSSFKR